MNRLHSKGRTQPQSFCPTRDCCLLPFAWRHSSSFTDASTYSLCITVDYTARSLTQYSCMQYNMLSLDEIFQSVPIHALPTTAPGPPPKNHHFSQSDWTVQRRGTKIEITSLNKSPEESNTKHRRRSKKVRMPFSVIRPFDLEFDLLIFTFTFVLNAELRSNWHVDSLTSNLNFKLIPLLESICQPSKLCHKL